MPCSWQIRQQPLLGRARRDRIVELRELEALGAQHRLELGVRADGVVRDAGVTDLAVALQLPQRRDVRAPVEQVVDLQQIEPRRLHRAQRAARSARVPCRARWSTPWSRRTCCACLPSCCTRSPVTRFGVAVHRRAVDQPRAGAVEHFEHLLQRRALVRPAADVERVPGSHADHRHALAVGRRRNLPAHHLARLRARGRCGRACGGAAQVMATVPRKSRRFMARHGPARLMRVQYCPSSDTCSVNCLKSTGLTI